MIIEQLWSNMMNRFAPITLVVIGSLFLLLINVGCDTMRTPTDSVPFVTSTVNASNISTADKLESETSTPAPSTDSAELFENLILYVQEGQIWLLNIDVNQTRQITFDEGKDSRVFTPKWSPDGRSFVYKRYGKLWLSNRTGEIHREIVTEANDFWWINATVLRYCQQNGDSTFCFLFDIESETVEPIQTDNYWIFSVSPDTMKAFVQEYQIIEEEIQPQTVQFILDIETGQRIFEHETGEGFWTEVPRWTPNGQKVAFTASIPEQTSRGEVFVVNINGENLTQLTHFSEEEGIFIYPALLQWSPDGEWLALVITTVEANELAILKSDGSILKRLDIEWLTLGQSNLAPVWSPDSKRIAFLSNQINIDNSNWQIYAVDIETGEISQLTSTSGNKTWLDWK
jgi:Tol biopolymer transport system component